MARKLGLLVTLVIFAVAVLLRQLALVLAVHETMRWIGAGLIFVCISGRTWCSLYIGGRKTHELVTTGPYSVSRNPLYVFSIIGAIGIGAQFGAVSVAVLAGVCAWLVHILVVRQEERLLLAEHGEAYAKYLAEVPRFFPRFSLWKNVDVLEVRPHAVRADLRRCVHLPRRHPGRRGARSPAQPRAAARLLPWPAAARRLSAGRAPARGAAGRARTR